MPFFNAYNSIGNITILKKKGKEYMSKTLLTKNNCIGVAIYKSGKSLAQILNEINQEKKLENKVIKLHTQGRGLFYISSKLNITRGRVQSIIKFDKIGLSYRKVGQKNRWI